nr:iron uptake system protein EfeO [uncultured Halomonas sp.]
MPKRSPSSQAPSPRLLRIGMALALLLMIAALVLFYFSLNGGQPKEGDTTAITVTASGCEPNSVTVPAGRTTFTVINRSSRAIEWEILDGVMVLEERENIAPELRQPLTAELSPGDYQMTCGLLSNPRGTLHVTAAEGAVAPDKLSAKAFIGPLAEYKVYLILQSRQLQSATKALRDAIADGDLMAAQARYREARRVDQHLAMALGLFSDLDQRINARAAYFERREKDPDFLGFHRLAYGLFEQRSMDGLTPVAEQLVADVETLSQRLRTQAIPPTQLANGTARVLQAWHDHQAAQDSLGERELHDLQGLKQGADKIVTLLKPLLERQSPSILDTLQEQLDELDRVLAPSQAQPDGSPVAEQIDRPALLKSADALADSLADVNRSLTLSS